MHSLNEFQRHLKPLFVNLELKWIPNFLEFSTVFILFKILHMFNTFDVTKKIIGYISTFVTNFEMPLFPRLLLVSNVTDCPLKTFFTFILTYDFPKAKIKGGESRQLVHTNIPTCTYIM